jgi:MFS transporter, DHA2 family, multidrug resistance protein
MTTANLGDNPIQGAALILMTLSLTLATFMTVLDSSIANVAIPSITSDFGASPYQGTWIITAFGTSMAIMLPLSGWLADRFGTVRLFVSATAAFTLFSVLCALSMSFTILIMLRILQGAAAGIMFPLSQSLLLMNYPSEKKGLATALWNMTAALGPIFGPALGGWITENWNWSWIFYINLPVGVFSTYFAWHFLSSNETPIQKVPIDTIGIFLVTIGVACLQILLDKGQELDWFNSTNICMLAVISVISLSFLVVWELTSKHPVIDLRLFKHRNFTLGTIALSLGFLVLFGNIVIFPLWLQTQMGYTETLAGLATAATALLTIVIAPFLGQKIYKFNLKVMSITSLVIFGFSSFWIATLNTQADFFHIVVPRFIEGAGISFFFIPLYLIILSGLPKNQTTSALGLATFFRILGASFGTSLSITLWKRREAFHHAQLTENITALNSNSAAILNKMQALGIDGAASLETLNNTITQQSFMLATNEYYWLSGIIFLSLIFLICLTKPTLVTNNPGRVK